VTKPFHILLALLSLLIGLQVLASCSDSDTETPDIGIPIPSSSSNIAQSSSDGSDNSNNSSSSGDNSSDSSSSSNSSSSEETLPLPAIELLPSGYYPDGLSITVPAETELGAVRCNTSGTAPNENSPIEPGSTLNFSTKNAILQCASFKNGKITSKTIMRTYIIERLPDLPIVSIAVDPEAMFTSSQALYKSSQKPGMDCGGASSTFYTEEVVPIHVDFFEKGANLAWSYPAGIHIHGGCSRAHPKKSVIVSFKEKYGQKNLKYPLFPEYPNLTKFKHFMLRNNGNNYPYDYMRDMLMSSLTEGLNIDYQKGRAVVVYYNGEYYGIHNLRERANGDYFETNYGINEDLINLVNVEKLNGAPEEVSKGSDADYQSIVSWLNGVSLADNNNFKELEQRIDVDNFTNHFQSRIFYRDCDWPSKNMKRWRSNLTNSKWRWLLYDTDHGFGSWGTSYLSERNYTMMQFITATSGQSWPNPPHSTFMLRKLLENEGYKNAFINRFSVLIATYFTTQRINARINALTAQISSETSYDQAKWGAKNESYLPKTMANFASDRPTSMQNEIGSFWNLGTPVELTLSVSGSGKILVHNLPLPSWNPSVTFNVYPTVPITLKAEGTNFQRWSDNITTRERTETITTSKTLTAIFN
jgi:hypothetical protein